MHKLLGFILGVVLLAPLPSLAKDLTEYRGSGTGANLYISNDANLIHISSNGNDITGEVWTGSDWSDTETIFVDSGEDFDLDENYSIHELSTGAIVIRQDEDLVSYSEDYGFLHATLADPTAIGDIVVQDDALSIVYCTQASEDPTAVLWNEANGLLDAVALVGGLCTGDLSYMTGQKQILLDYYTGTAYDVTNSYSVVATTDLSDLGYVGEDDDYDDQGYRPMVYTQKNGDILLVFGSQLYGYDYGAAAWEPIVTLESDYELVGPEESSESYFPIMQTVNQKRSFAFSANDANTDFQIYRWTESGWELEKTYSFDDDAELITTTTDKGKKNLEWAFWQDDTDTLNIYRWNKNKHYNTRSTRDLTCSSSCEFTLDTSKKGKIFLTWSEFDALDAAAWDPNTNVWQDTTLVNENSSEDGVVINSQITSLGQWIVEYEGENHKVLRWTPDTGWGAAYTLTSEGSYYDDDTLYLVGLTSYVLTVRQFSFDDGSKITTESIDDISSFNASSSFVYDDGVFLYYATRDGERVMDKVELE